MKPTSVRLTFDRREFTFDLVSPGKIEGSGRVDLAIVSLSWIRGTENWEARLTQEKGKEIQSSWKPTSKDPDRKAKSEEEAKEWIEESRALLRASYALAIQKDGHAALALQTERGLLIGDFASIFRTSHGNQTVVPALPAEPPRAGTTWPVVQGDVPTDALPPEEGAKPPAWKVTSVGASGTTMTTSIEQPSKSAAAERGRATRTARSSFNATVVFSAKGFLTSSKRSLETSSRVDSKEAILCKSWNSKVVEEMTVKPK